MRKPTREYFSDRGYCRVCPCGELLSGPGTKKGWGNFVCAKGHLWRLQYGEWAHLGSVHDEPDPVLEEEERECEWSQREREDVWSP